MWPIPNNLDDIIQMDKIKKSVLCSDMRLRLGAVPEIYEKIEMSKTGHVILKKSNIITGFLG